MVASYRIDITPGKTRPSSSGNPVPDVVRDGFDAAVEAGVSLDGTVACTDDKPAACRYSCANIESAPFPKAP
jgi:hypothetical protein